MKNKKRGFTLVEAVVVIAVIGILASIISSKMKGIMAKARDAKAVTSMDALRKASMIYFTENNAPLKKETFYVTLTDIEKLISSKYLEPHSLYTFTKKDREEGDVRAYLEVGSENTEEKCGNNFAPTHLKLVFQDDGVDIKFESEKYDSNCKLWNEK
ncbi:MAG: prepilin-type N-terminal cleavage/methylation domain-containing protein [Cetobacterium sp.]